MTQRKFGWLLLMAAVAQALTLALSVAINTRMTRESARGDCDTLRISIDVYQETPPTTPTGVKLEQAYRARYAELKC